jgi:hypothetical protein
MMSTIPGAAGAWACPSHGNFVGGGDGAAVSATVATAGDGVDSFVPGTDVLTLVGGDLATPPTFDVTHTKVIAYAIAAAGTGGTPGAVTVTGTTGTGTPFQIAGTIDGGGTLSALGALSVAGDYTVNPTDVAGEPVTGGGLVGAEVAVFMGVLTAELADGGLVGGDPPANPVATTNSGAAAGCTLNVVYGSGGTDAADVQAIAQAVSGAAGANILTVGL